MRFIICLVFALTSLGQPAEAGEQRWFKMNTWSQSDYLDVVFSFGVADRYIQRIIPQQETDNPFDDKRVNQARLQELKVESLARMAGVERANIGLYFEDIPTTISKYNQRKKSFFICVPGLISRGPIISVAMKLSHLIKVFSCYGKLPLPPNSSFSKGATIPMPSEDMAEKLFNATYKKKLLVDSYCWVGKIETIQGIPQVICTITKIVLKTKDRELVVITWGGNKFNYRFSL